MKIIFFYCSIFSFLLCNPAAGQVQDPAYNLLLQQMLTHSVKEISVKEVAAKSSNVLFLDAREKKEYNVSHLKDAVFVGYDHFDMAALKNIDKDQRIVVYCSVGYRSEKIADQLVKAGYSHVANLYGGIFEWVNEGYTVYDLAGNATPKIHPYDATWGIWLKKGEKAY
ncbi:MAG: rhodanese-like domain-containing protein [Chitinophagales bacterium]